MILPQVSTVAGSAASTAGRYCPTPALWILPNLSSHKRRFEALRRLRTYEGSVSKSRD